MNIQEYSFYPCYYGLHRVKKVKVSSYIARYPVLRTAQSTLHFTPRQTCSFQCQLDFSGKLSNDQMSLFTTVIVTILVKACRIIKTKSHTNNDTVTLIISDHLLRKFHGKSKLILLHL